MLSKSVITILFYLSTLSYGAAYAADWFEIATTTTGETRYIDLDSIEAKTDYVHYWSKTRYRENPTIKEATFFWTMNCAEGTGSLQAFVQYDPHNRVIRDETYTDDAFHPVPSNSMGEVYLRFVCNWAAALNQEISATRLKQYMHQFRKQEYQ